MHEYKVVQTYRARAVYYVEAESKKAAIQYVQTGYEDPDEDNVLDEEYEVEKLED